MYHSLRLYKLLPELRWAAGGFIWPVDSTVECGSFFHHSPRSAHARGPYSPGLPMTPGSRHRRAYSGRNGFTLYRDPGSDSTDDDDGYFGNEAATLRSRIEANGAIPIARAGIKVLQDDAIGVGESVTKEKISYISAGGLEKLIINVLMVVFIP